MEAKKILLFVGALLALLSLACGQVVVPVEQPGNAPAQPAPAEAAPSPLETLAPLPGSGEEADSGPDAPAGAGDPIMANDIAWTLLDALYLGGVLESDSDEIPDLVAEGTLLGVRFTIDNQGAEPRTYIGLELADNLGRRYSYLGDSLDFIIDEERCELVDLGPGDVVTCTAVYDIPDGTGGLQAVFTDLSLVSGDEILLDLGLD